MSKRLLINVYSAGFTIASSTVDATLNRDSLRFGTFYPGGIYGNCSFFVPADPSMPHSFIAGYRVGIFDGLKMVWEGAIDTVTYVSTPTQKGLKVECVGYWGTILKRRRWDKVWCDTRITNDKWVESTGNEGYKFRINRYDAIRMAPVEADFVTDDDTRVIYTLPTGQTVNRVTSNYELYEGTQAWGIQWRDITNGSAIVSVSSSGTSTWAGTPGAGCTQISFSFYAAGTQTANYDDEVYGLVSNVKVYTEAGSVNATEIVKDIRGHITTLSTDESWIGDNFQVIEPAYMEGETVAEYLTKIASFGDTSLNPWAAGVVSSQEALSGGYKPVLYFKVWPALTGYEYKVRLEDIEGGCNIEAAYDEIANWIMIEYKDENDTRVRITPDDDANLKDTTSIADYGQRDVLLRLGSVGETEAKIYARRYLAWFKDLHYRLTTPIKIKGTVRRTGSGIEKVHAIRAGLRIMIENYLQQAGGSGIIMIVTATEYDEESDTITVSAGTPNPLETLATRIKEM